MSIVIIRPDNFHDPSGARYHILRNSVPEDLLDRALDIYGIQVSATVEAQLWTYPCGYTNRRRFLKTDILQNDIPTLYLKLVPIPSPGGDAS